MSLKIINLAKYLPMVLIVMLLATTAVSASGVWVGDGESVIYVGDSWTYIYVGLSELSTTTLPVGVEAFAAVIPVLILAVFLAGSLGMGFLGYREFRESNHIVSIQYMAIGVLLIAVGLIIFPIIINAVDGVINR